MDPLTAFGIASNVFQILDFAAKIVVETSRLLYSTEERPNDVAAWERAAASLTLVQDVPMLIDSTGLSLSEQTVLRLAANCRSLATELTATLADLKPVRKPDGRKSKISAIKLAVRNTSSVLRKDIELKQVVLQQAEGQLAVGLMNLIRDEQHANFREIETGFSLSNAKILKAVLDAKEDLLTALEFQRQLLRKEHEARHLYTIGHVLELTATSKEVWEALVTQSDQDRALRVINSLRFAELKVRRDTIEQALHETYRWSFDDQAPLTAWLASDDSLFWVTGKAGSGKSTLMKYLASAKETRSLLKRWSMGLRLCVVDVYFWYPGSPMQKSDTGLLQTILFQILDSIPSLVRVVAPNRWEAAKDPRYKAEDWTREEMSEALDIIAKSPLGHEDVHFCLFIDGLDEFDGHHLRLIRQIRGLVASPRIKGCVSSRPWNVFSNEFGNMPSSLRLEDLNRPDIIRYVNAELNYYILNAAEGRLLVEEIAAKASGVFLWVYFTVKSLHEGIAEEDSLATLRRRVDSYPTDLDQFFDLILKRVDPIYRKSTGQALHMATLFAKAGVQSSFVDYWLLRLETPSPEDADFAYEVPLGKHTGRELRAMTVQTRKFLARATKDLLHLPNPAVSEGAASYDDFDTGDWPAVEFLHRTVYEFLSAPERQNALAQDSPAYYTDDDFLSKVVLARLKVVPQEAQNLSAYCMNLAAWALDMDYLAHLETRFVSSMEEVVIFYMRTSPFIWTASKTDIMLESFVAFGLCTCVKEVDGVTAARAPMRRLLRILLKAALGFSKYQRFPLSEVSLPTLETVLRMGADPNSLLGGESDSETIWDRFLARWRLMIMLPGSQLQQHRLEQVWEAAKILIRYGAELRAIHSAKAGDGQVRRASLPLQVLESRMPSTVAGEIKSILLEADSKHHGAGRSKASQACIFTEEAASYESKWRGRG